MRSLRLVFFGTPAFAVPALERLLRTHHQLVVVVTQPDRPRGRGHLMSQSPVKERAAAAGIPVLQPERLKDPGFVADLAAVQPDLGIVAAYGRILPEIVLQIPPLGFLNIHASLLPKYRGAAPVQRALMAGDTQLGVTIMRVVFELDAGPMLASRTRPIHPDETNEIVEHDLARLGGELLIEVVDRLATGAVAEQPQNHQLATYAPRLTKSDGLIDWTRPALEIHNKVRALHPWPHAFTYLAGERYLILRTAVLDDPQIAGTTSASRARPEPAEGARPEPVAGVRPGTILQAHGDLLTVAAGDRGAVRIVQIQPEGRRAMTVREFQAGHSIRAGSVFEPAP